MSSLDVGLDGEICTLDAVGGLFDTTTVSVMLADVVVQASPLVPLTPLAVIPAIPAVTVPLPEAGAVQSKLHARFALFVCVTDLPLTLTPELPPVESEPLETSTLKPPCVPDTPPDTEI